MKRSSAVVLLALPFAGCADVPADNTAAFDPMCVTAEGATVVCISEPATEAAPLAKSLVGGEPVAAPSGTPPASTGHGAFAFFYMQPSPFVAGQGTATRAYSLPAVAARAAPAIARGGFGAMGAAHASAAS